MADVIRLRHHHNDEKEEELLIKSIPNNADLRKVSKVVKCLSDNTRLKIFWILCHTEECVVNIATLVKMSSPATSHHLKVLKSCNLLETRRSGKEMYYKVADNEIANLLHKSIEKIMEVSCPGK